MSAQYTTSHKQLITITETYRSDNVKVHRLIIFCNFIESSRKLYLKFIRTGCKAAASGTSLTPVAPTGQ